MLHRGVPSKVFAPSCACQEACVGFCLRVASGLLMAASYIYLRELDIVEMWRVSYPGVERGPEHGDQVQL